MNVLTSIRSRLRAIFVGSRPMVAGPALDLAADERDRYNFQRYIVKNALYLVPAAGIALVATNIYVQMHGDVGLAVAVVQNLTIGALALTVVLNLLTYAILGGLFAAVLVITDNAYSPVIRVRVSAIATVLIIIETRTVPLAIGAGVAVLILGYRYLDWRVFKRAPAKPEAGQPMIEILRSQQPPLDLGLREIWTSGRSGLRQKGEDVPRTELDADPGSQGRVLTIDEATQLWNQRHAEIAPKRHKGIQSLVFAALIGFVTVYGVSILLNPLRFGPLVAVSINHTAPLVGYALLPDGQHGVVLNQQQDSITYVSGSADVNVLACQPKTNWWSATAWSSAQKSTGLDCDALTRR